VIEFNADEWIARLAFRDYLNQHVQARQEYAQLKEMLARQFSHDREAYTEGKTTFIKNIAQQAYQAL